MKACNYISDFMILHCKKNKVFYVIWVLLLKPSKRNKHSLFYRLILHTLHPGKAPHLSQHKIFMTNNQAHSQHKKYIPVVEENIIFAQCLLISPLHASFCRSELLSSFNFSGNWCVPWTKTVALWPLFAVESKIVKLRIFFHSFLAAGGSCELS